MTKRYCLIDCSCRSVEDNAVRRICDSVAVPLLCQSRVDEVECCGLEVIESSVLVFQVESINPIDPEARPIPRHAI